MHKKNNFDFLRLLFASLVIITHSYVLSGSTKGDWLHRISDQQLSFSDIGVKGFFIISGFLIFQSLERSNSLVDYYWKRVLRLFPALAVVLLLTVLLAPLVYQSALPYLHNKAVWTYVPNNLLLYRNQYTISGVFDNNKYQSVINGSLWTISYEFTMYLLLSFLFFFRKNAFVVNAILIGAFSLLMVGNLFFFEQLGKHNFILAGKWLLDLSAFFMAGSLLASLKIAQRNYFNLLAIVAFAVVVISLKFNCFAQVKFFTLPVIIICFGLRSTLILNAIGETIGDLSYGIYIYAFPVQQTLVYYFNLDCLQLFFYSLIISSVFAYLSWHLIESKALQFKRITSKHLRSENIPQVHF
jgi:peptidoglycan/LPS O-acetylase OafA/YrhL